jgi:hypothetical protein
MSVVVTFDRPERVIWPVIDGARVSVTGNSSDRRMSNSTRLPIAKHATFQLRQDEHG